MEKINLNLDIIRNANFDSIKTEFSSKYQQKGITYRSNDPEVIKRDDAGNIILLEGETNQLLQIEPIATNITTTSMLKILDTQFTYYKFPTTYPIETTLDLNLDTNIELDTIDPVYARYKPSENLKLGYTGEGDVSPSDRASGILMDEVVEGTTQTNVNAYYITKEVKESGVDLRFRAKINHRFDSTSYEPKAIAGAEAVISNPRSRLYGRSLEEVLPGYIPKSNIWFFISKQGPNFPLNRAIAGPFARNSVNPLYADEYGSIAQYEEQNTFIDVIIPNEQFEIGDYFGITQINATGIVTESDPAYHTINSEQTYWVITDASKNVDEWNQEI